VTNDPSHPGLLPRGKKSLGEKGLPRGLFDPLTPTLSLRERERERERERDRVRGSNTAYSRLMYCMIVIDPLIPPFYPGGMKP